MIGVVFSVALLIVVFSVPTYAVHDTGVFQLDGDAASGTQPIGPPATDDWDKVCHQYGANPGICGTSANTSGSTAGLWTCDTSPAASNNCTINATIFTGGGSKDPQPISNWNWKDGAGGLPAKDNLVHAFAVRYSLIPSATCPSTAATCEVIYFGLDRFDNSGDAQNGFWFFKGAVGLNTDGSFSGAHQPGDVLVVSDFSNGGGTSTISVYTWDPTCTATNKPSGFCADANLHTQASLAAANCASPTPSTGDPFCGIVNPGNSTVVPWSSDYTDKSGNHTTYLNGEFYEAGINLSSFGLGGECFSSVAAESRSSTSTTATLKDFVLGGFGKCESGLVTTAKDGSGGTIPDGGLSIGTGSVSVKDSANLTVSGVSTWSGTLSFHLCFNTTCATGGTAVGSPLAVSNSTVFPVLSDAATVTSVGQYCWRGDFVSGTTGLGNASDSGATNSKECFTVNPVPTALTTTAGDDVLLGNPVTDTAGLSGTANQPGSPIINGPLGLPAGGKITFTLLKADCLTLATGTGTNPQDKTVSGDGTYGPVSFTPDAVGTYHWAATYTPDSSGNTLGTSHNTSCTDAGEDVVVTQIPTTTKTTPEDSSGNAVTTVTFGSMVGDHAVVSANLSGGPAVIGNVTFFICNPTQVTANGGTCSTGGTQVGSPVDLTPLATTPPSSFADSGLITANATGTWCFRGVYTPTTSAYTGSSDASTGECFNVTDTTGATSGQTWLPNDSATVASAHGAPLKGTLTLQLYDGSNDCTIGAVGGQSYTKTLSGSNSTETISSNNTTYLVSATDEVSWLVTFTSSDPNVGSSSHCEKTSLTITN